MTARPAADVSVVICTRDRPDALARCLAALAAGDTRPAEVIVVDQGRDGSAAAVVGRFSDALRTTYLRQTPRGLAAAQNAAVHAASRRIVAVTDDDCLPDRTWLGVIGDVFATATSPAVLTGRVLPAPAEGDRVCAVATRTSEQRREFVGRHVPWHVGSGNNFAVTREWYQRVGGCDERLGPGAPGAGGVDMDLFYRLLRAGARVRYEPAALVLHERQTPHERAVRRPLYGHGMGACFSLWLRQGDLYALPAAARWIALRLGRIVRPPGIARRAALREELAILRATLRGALFGLRAPAPHAGAATTEADSTAT